MKLRALLVDDEPLAIERLKGFLEHEPDVEILGTSSNGLEALEAIRQLKPELVFLDIQMPELDGFEVIEALDPESIPLIVFVTAYDRFAIRAFEAQALDYLLKPFSLERLKGSLQRAKEAHQAVDAQEKLRGLLEDIDTRRKDRFVLRHEDRFIVIPTFEVDAIEAEANYMWIYRGHETYSLRATMATLEKRLETHNFVRTHRSWMLNIRKVKELLPGAKGGLIALTSGQLQVPVSAGHRKDLEEKLGIYEGID